MSFMKLVHSAVLPDQFNYAVTLIEDPVKFVKCAADASLPFDYAALKPDKDHVGIHLVGLGDVETFGFNRNGDGFPKDACIKYHDTFVKHGHVYRHHLHDDPKKSIGTIKASCYSEPMHRIELFIHANKEKARPELEKLASDAEVPFSMSCRVPGDRCARCNTFRKSAKDPNQCDHVKYALGKVEDDGKVNGVYNDDPKFFDISFVIKPADRIAWSLKTAGVEDLTKIASSALAEMEGMRLDPAIMLDSARAFAKYELAKKIAGYEELYAKLAEVGPKTAFEREVWELRKSAAVQALPDGTIELFRNYDPQDVFYAMAKEKILMDPVSYVKYALGTDMGTLAPHIEEIKRACAGICSELIKSGEIYDACNDGTYDVADYLKYGDYGRTVAEMAAAHVKHAASLDLDFARHRTVLNTMDQLPVETMLKKMAEKNDSSLAKCVARKYVAYKLAAADAMQALDRNINEHHFALMAARNVVKAN